MKNSTWVIENNGTFWNTHTRSWGPLDQASRWVTRRMARLALDKDPELDDRDHDVVEIEGDFAPFLILE